ncbi:MAG: FAD-dependent thymidylate synthase [Nitrosopumilus sp.]
MSVTEVKVLDKGYVRLVDHMGSDLSVVNAARVSFAKESSEMKGKDEKLIKYLAEHNHMSPFRHAFITLEVKAPLLTARQWWKYCVGSDHTMDSWNEVSRRYVEDDPEYYIPDDNMWRGVPEIKKQGSSEEHIHTNGDILRKRLITVTASCDEYYKDALRWGVAPEQARLFLPAYSMYTMWRWSASLQSVAHFLNQRIADDSQYEIREYANAVEQIVEPLFPVCMKELRK